MLPDFLTGPDAGVYGLLALAGLFAGWVDAVVGGGGLVQLPATLLIPGVTPVQALATNKVGSVAGTLASSWTYVRTVGVQWRTLAPMALVAGSAAFLGALCASLLPGDVFRPLIVGALALVLVLTVFRPGLGESRRLRFTGKAHVGSAVLLGAVIGFYDGLIGPGTGAFLAMGLVALVGYSLMEATAKAKVVNAATNAGALVYFIPAGFFAAGGMVQWRYALVLAGANLVGGVVGARTALRGGRRFVRIVMVAVVAALLARQGYVWWEES